MNRRILGDLALAVVVGGAAGISPLSSPRIGLSLLAGVGVGAAVFLYRQTDAQRGRAAEGVAEPAAGASVLPAFSVLLFLLLFAAVFTPTVRWMYGQWTGSLWYNSHGIFVPLVMAYLAWIAVKDDRGDEDASAWGFAYLVPGLALVVLDAPIRTYHLAAVGLVLCLPGLSLLLLGRHRTRRLAVPLLAAVFMVPVPVTSLIHLPLRMVTTAGVGPLLHLMGFTNLREGTQIELVSGVFVISDACSGFATLYAAVGVAIILACYTRAPLRRAILLLSAVPLAITCNVIRVTTLILLSHFFGRQVLDTAMHEASGVAAFWLILLLIWAIADTRKLRSASR